MLSWLYIRMTKIPRQGLRVPKGLPLRMHATGRRFVRSPKVTHLYLGAGVVPYELFPAFVLRVGRYQRRPLPPPRGVAELLLEGRLVMIDLRS